jgi:hypothetical protein
MYNKTLRQHLLRVFDVLAGASIYFLLDAEYSSSIPLNLQRPEKIYVKSNLRQPLIT